MVHPDQTKFQRILFRTSPVENIADCELLTVTFGVNCAPYLAIRTLKQLSKDVQLKYPLAAKVIESDFYVDDLLSGAHDLQTAKSIQLEVIEALNSAGFPLRKWTSNSSFLLDHLPSEHVLSENFLKIDSDSTTKTLGIRWNAKDDFFYFTTQPLKFSTTPTKREVFSEISKLFDPAGWLTPIIVTAKILMQRIWIEETKWDELIKSNTFLIWKTFVEAFSEIQLIKIPRWTEYTPSSQVQFHGFCDSSEQAYAASL